jgi:hypothetical protein
MALQAIPLPSLGVSSLDLGRSFNRTAHFFSLRLNLFGGGARNGETGNARDQRAHHRF